ncbi:PhoU domain-containing protein, partial [Halobium palmae]
DGDERAARDVHRVLMTVRDVERIGDHAVNIAARTLYMAESSDELLF